jgi:hypothetical protein
MAKLNHDHNDGKRKAGAMLDALTSPPSGQNAQPPPEDTPLPPFEFFPSILSKMPPEPPLLIGGPDAQDPRKNALLHQGDKMMLGAESKAGKTWYLLQKSLCIAAGIPFLGHKTTMGTVLYCNFELRPWSFARRVEKVALALGIIDGAGRSTLRDKKGNSIPPNFIGWNLRGKCYDIQKVCDVAEHRIKSAGQDMRIAAIVVDPLYKSYGGADENSATDMAAVLQAMESFSEKLGAAILIASHFAKGNASDKAQIDRISGSGVIARDPDSIFTLTRFKDEKDCFLWDAVLRNMASPEPKIVQFTHPIWSVREDLSPSGQGYNLGKFIALLGDAEMASGEWEKAAQEDGICAKHDNFQKLKKECLDKGLVTEKQAGKSKLYKKA